ncbi:Metallo-hydrolase/oxidoreductase [Exidia glandulosa HHB12029]|uniref:Metallo-hydrolase/oxidoreductase n=1 Tax=Exidia glandulosa HHB12029 TaxID=1314781 RepID=A0A165FCM6_EXIGL|nr:Metallo-hydrolase/oxidoreductase [Exidia glandulosa HHB12029]
MSPSSFRGTLNITHITTATAILEIGTVKLLTDPFFSPAGTEFDRGHVVLKITEQPALALHDLPPIDAVLLSHEDHPDNLDELGRQLLDGRRVLTTRDGARKLAPRPGVRGLAPWETVELEAGGKTFSVTATPCEHVPGGECTGFVIASPEFGTSDDGRQNVIWFSGDTVYMDELRQLRDKFHVVVAIVNLGFAHIQTPDGGKLAITMDGKQAARLFREIGAEVLGGEGLREDFEEAGIQDKVRLLTPGVSVKIL